MKSKVYLICLFCFLSTNNCVKAESKESSISMWSGVSAHKSREMNPIMFISRWLARQNNITLQDYRRMGQSKAMQMSEHTVPDSRLVKQASFSDTIHSWLLNDVIICNDRF